MQNDREIKISVGSSRKSTNWQPATMRISELYKRCEVPARSAENLTEYLGYKKAQQDDLKDCCGGFVGGTFNGSRRKANSVIGRDIVTLDFDNIPAGGTDDVLRRVEALGCNYCVYSTRKHQPSAPRLRVLLPLDRTVNADEYEPIARKMAEYIGIQFADPTTFECSRLMYWPTCCSDSEYIYRIGDKPFINANGVLATYSDWHNTDLWPQVPGEQQSFSRLASKQGDPEAKPGTVGAFCRTYDIYRAMDELIPGIYEPLDNDRERFTFTGGSTTGGAVLYDGGKFLYSHHATDPCGGKLVNAFDLVRLHKFGDKDDEATPGAPTNRLPSYTAMLEYANSLPDVSALINTERYNEAVKDFAGVTADNGDDPANWMQLLDKAENGSYLKTIKNIRTVLENDPSFKGKLYCDTFADRIIGICPVPIGKYATQKPGTTFTYADDEAKAMRGYMEELLGFDNSSKLDAAFSAFILDHSQNPVQEYLNALAWDNTPRLDTVFIDYLGADDSSYTRAVTRKAFTAAVARAMDPGCKFDNMLILSGPQGIGKSTVLDKMSRGWFCDSIRTFEGKEASELLQNVWIVEIAELDAFRRADVARIKQFLSVRADRYRAAYGRFSKEHPRTCIFFGTTNSAEYLQDTTGNRRFWPIDTAIHKPAKNVWRDLDNEIDQLWAEAVVRYRAGEPLFLTGDIEKTAKARQEDHREVSAKEGVVLGFIEKQVPEDWSKWPLDKRRLFWSGGVQGSIKLIDRDRVCAQEIWCEAFGGSIKEYNNRDANEINSIIAAMGEWERSNGAIHIGGDYSKQRGFYRKRMST